MIRLGLSNCILVKVGTVMNHTELRLIVVAMVLMASLCCGRSSSSSKATQAPGTFPLKDQAIISAEDHIRHVAAFYANVRTAQVEVQQETTNGSSDEIQRHTCMVYADRPSRIAVRNVMDCPIEIVSRPDASYTAEMETKQYWTGESLGTLNELAFNPRPLMAAGWGAMFVPALICDDPFPAIMTDVDVIEYVAEEQLDGVATHRVRFEQPTMHWEMWIRAGTEPLVLKLTIHVLESAQPSELPAGKTTVLFRNWKVNQALPGNEFSIVPPPEFELVKPPAEANNAVGPNG